MKDKAPIKLTPGVSYFKRETVEKYSKELLKKITGNDTIEIIEKEDKNDESS